MNRMPSMYDEEISISPWTDKISIPCMVSAVRLGEKIVKVNPSQLRNCWCMHQRITTVASATESQRSLETHALSGIDGWNHTLVSSIQWHHLVTLPLKHFTKVLLDTTWLTDIHTHFCYEKVSISLSYNSKQKDYSQILTPAFQFHSTSSTFPWPILLPLSTLIPMESQSS